jgi:hypothetical protein
MTQRHLDRAVASRTGESLRTVRRHRFSTPAVDPGGEDPADLRLVVDCPFCRRPVPYPGPAGDGSASLAECLVCDVYFDCGPDDVYAAGPASARDAG